MKKPPKKTVMVKNKVTGEQWLCDNWSARRVIDQNTFIEVYKPLSDRKLWININTVVRGDGK